MADNLPVSVTYYKPPIGKKSVVFWACALFYFVVSSEANFRPGSLLYDYVFSSSIFPNAVFELLQTYRLPGLYSLFGIHAFEAIIFASRIGQHGLTPASPAWWLWMGSCLVEGVGAFLRHGDAVKEQETARKRS